MSYDNTVKWEGWIKRIGDNQKEDREYKLNEVKQGAKDVVRVLIVCAIAGWASFAAFHTFAQ